ncbi:alpha/beta hydrolase [Thalassotalea ganghwensis]
MRIFLVISSVLTIFSSGLTIAKSIDCVSINTDIEHIKTLKDSGQYRRIANDMPAPEFRYQEGQSYQKYLDFAAKLIAVQNPKAQIKCPIETGVTKLQGKSKATMTVADVVAPFELTNNNHSKGILLIHGLTDSPYLFHDLATFYHQQGFNVRTLLLPGHGTAPQALIDVDFTQWQQASAYAIEKTIADFEQVYLGGFSTGGALILDYLLTQPSVEKNIKGVMLWAPASQAKSKFAWAAKFVDWLPFVDYASKGADIDFAKYESFPLNAGAQVHALMNQLGKKIAKAQHIPDIPLLTITSEVDNTIDTQATLALLNTWHTNANRNTAALDTLFYFGDPKSAHALPTTFTKIFAQCQQRSYCDSIINVAHTSVTNAPTNPHYGWQGNYRNCEAIAIASDYQQCKLTEQPVLGETITSNMEKTPYLQRLTFNPSYQQMLSIMSDFIVKTNGGIK